MAYAKVTRTKNGSEAIKYAEGNGTGHNGSKLRNEYIGTVNMLPGIPVTEQMQVYWNKARSNHTNQILRVIQSFHLKELDPKKREDIIRANMIGQLFAERFYPGHQAVVYTQTDGVGGKIHNHVLINDVGMDGKGLHKDFYYAPVVREWTNQACDEYIIRYNGDQKTADKTTQTERAKREKGEWVYKDDIKQRVKLAMARATDEASFLKELTAVGIDAEVKDSKKYGHYYTYELVDLGNMPEDAKMPRNLKARSYKLGEAYGPEALEDMINYRTRTNVTTESRVSGGATQKKEEEKRETPDVMDFDTFTKRMLPSDEQWVIYDEHGKPSIDDEMYEKARKKYQDYLRDGKLTEPVTTSEPEKESEDEPKEESELVQEPEKEVSEAAEPVMAVNEELEVGMTHDEKMMILYGKSREQQKRASEGQLVARKNREAVQRETKHKVPNLTKIFHEKTGKDMDLGE